MDYNKELLFVEKLLHNLQLNLRFFPAKSFSPFSTGLSLGLQDLLNFRFDEDALLQMLVHHCKSNTIYHLKNQLLCQYLLFRLPDTDHPTYAYIGPYTTDPVTSKEILSVAERFQVAPGNLGQLEQFYLDLPLIADENQLFTLLYTLGEYLWDDADHFTLHQNFELPITLSGPIAPLPDIHTPEEALLSMQILEKRYETENHLLQAVTAGRLHKAELFFSNLLSRQFEQRTGNPLRDLKNYAIVLNTLLRKAAEKAVVHPIHLHSISSQYARKIEALTSKSSCIALTKEMVRKYCLLVKNHSLKGYSLLIRKVIARIDFDLTADLSLKTQAELLNVNSSYLSTLFKKETGSTLTEYVNRKRVEHALLLLNSTDMQIQTIAQYCGITDVNYFTKTFKKIVGRTPKEYREMISSHL